MYVWDAAVSIVLPSTYAHDLALADVNNDGNIDALIADDGVAFVALGRGDGTFATAKSYTQEGAGGTESSISAGDLNGDGFLDLITAGQTAGPNGYLTVRLNRGDGTFASATSYANGVVSDNGTALGDLNGDGALDVATWGSANYLIVRLGRGDGTFQAQSTYLTTAPSGGRTRLGDFNGDGKLDAMGVSGSGTAVVLLGRGDGTFATGTSYSIGGTFVNDSNAVDLNGDGNLDILASSDNGGSNAQIGILFGNGNGTFRALVTYSTGNDYGFGLSVGDVNNDGVLDVVSAGQSATPYTGVFYSAGEQRSRRTAAILTCQYRERTPSHVDIGSKAISARAPARQHGCVPK